MIRWGIIGLGNISQRFIKSLAFSERGVIYAGASQTKEKREAFVENNKGVVAYSTYIELLQDPKVDAVYIALRHSDHYEWTKKALQHKKAVICEKPAVLYSEQAAEIAALAKENQVFFMEAMKTRFVPAVEVLKRVIDMGIIGEISRVENTYCSQADYDETSYLYDQEQGGALYDIGIYNIASVLDYIRADVKEIQVHAEHKYGVDVYDDIELTFDSGQTARIEVAIDRKKERSLKMTGSKGMIRLHNFSRPEEIEIELHDGTNIHIEKKYVHDDFFGQIEECHTCIEKGEYQSERMSHEDTIRCITLLMDIKHKKNA